MSNLMNLLILATRIFETDMNEILDNPPYVTVKVIHTVNR